MNQIIIYHHNTPSRIDKFLADQLGISRNLLQRIFDDGVVKVNDKDVKKSATLQEWDEIYIDVNIKRFGSEDVFPKSSYVELKVIHEHDDYIVIYKPKWVLSHPKNLRDVNSPSVASFLYHKYWSLEHVWPFVRAGIVHRLDKDTDGLMICVLSERWLKYFRALFDNRSDIWPKDVDTIRWQQYPDQSLQKYYKALCHITPTWLSKLRTMSLPYFINKIVIPKIPQKKQHKIGITEILNHKYERDDQWNSYENDKLVLFDIKLWTGRTHQIRYHLSSEWWPIVWDFLYNKTSKKDQQLQLTAYRIAFVDPDGLYIDLSI